MGSRLESKKLLLAGLFFLTTTGCGHRQGSASVAQVAKAAAVQPQMLMVAPPAKRTYRSTPPAVQFDYPGSWHSCPCKTAVFMINDPADDPKSPPSICLDIPKLPWHIPGMIPIGMVASGYVDDLRKNQIPDAVIQEQTSLKVCNENARRVTCAGHLNGKLAIDVAYITIHADHVYILSADSDDAGKAIARHTLDDAIASLKWTK